MLAGALEPIHVRDRRATQGERASPQPGDHLRAAGGLIMTCHACGSGGQCHGRLRPSTGDARRFAALPRPSPSSVKRGPPRGRDQGRPRTGRRARWTSTWRRRRAGQSVYDRGLACRGGNHAKWVRRGHPVRGDPHDCPGSDGGRRDECLGNGRPDKPADGGGAGAAGPRGTGPQLSWRTEGVAPGPKGDRSAPASE